MKNKPQYIVLIASDEGAHHTLVELLKPHIGEAVSYIDIEPLVVQEGKKKWLSVDR